MLSNGSWEHVFVCDVEEVLFLLMTDMQTNNTPSLAYTPKQPLNEVVHAPERLASKCTSSAQAGHIHRARDLLAKTGGEREMAFLLVKSLFYISGGNIWRTA